MLKCVRKPGMQNFGHTPILSITTPTNLLRACVHCVIVTGTLGQRFMYNGTNCILTKARARQGTIFLKAGPSRAKWDGGIVCIPVIETTCHVFVTIVPMTNNCVSADSHMIRDRTSSET